MSFRPRGRPPFHSPRGAPPFRPQPEPASFMPHQHDDRFQLCQMLQLRFPPEVQETYFKVMELKDHAEEEIRRKNLQAACMHYSMAIKALWMFPMAPFFVEELPRILCNRSLMFVRQRQFREAESDARECIERYPGHIKAYWRACQAVKGGQNGTTRALAYLAKGIPIVLRTGFGEDIPDFLTELCSLIPKADAKSDVLSPLHNVIWPSANSDVWMKVLRKLGNQGSWDSISMLINRIHKGPPNTLQGIGYAWDCRVLNIGSLLKSQPDSFLKAWGISLAVQLLQQKANIDDIGSKFDKPTIHVALEISLRTGHLELLDTVLDLYKDNLDKLNASNSQGQTVLHILVLTGKTNQSLHIDALDRLLGYNCDPSLVDHQKKKAIDYLHQFDPARQKLRAAEKTVEELRKEIDQYKNLGNSAFKDDLLHESLQCYSQALQVSKKSKELFKEAAKLYSNRANVHMSLKEYMEALENALASINSDASWHKGYWWKAKSFCGMRDYKDSFQAYVEGHMLPDLAREDRLKFLVEAVILLKDLQDPDLTECYRLLSSIDTRLWPTILAKISKAIEWKCLAYLLFGTNLNPARFGQLVTRESADKLLSGVAGKVTTADVDAKTVFVYLKQNQTAKCSHWLDAALFVVYLHGMERTLKSLREDEADTALHAVTKFSLKTGRFSMLNEVPSKEVTGGEGEINSHGDSVFHTITKMHPIPDSNILCNVTQKLLDKGYSAVLRDARHRLPIDCLGKSHPEQVFELYLKQSNTLDKDSINQLKEEGDALLRAGDNEKALELYTKAIQMLREVNLPNVTKRERAVLYANRAEAYLKLKLFDSAGQDAALSLQQDPHWYKAHMRLGKCLGKLNHWDDTFNSYTNGYNELDTTVEDKTKVDLLKDICSVARQLKRAGELKHRLLNSPRPHLWALTAYELIVKKDWLSANVAFSLVKGGPDTKRWQVTVSLQPLSCDLRQLKTHPWVLNLIKFLLESGANRKTISCESGDTYLHAVVRMSLIVQQHKMDLLTYLWKSYCRNKGTDQHKLDTGGNTLLHTAAREAQTSQEYMHKMIMQLLQYGVDPNAKNKVGKRAVDLLPRAETPSHEALRMAMYSHENKRQQTPEPNKIQQRPQSNQSEKPKAETKKGARQCDECEDLYLKALTYLDLDDVNKVNMGYDKLVELMMQKSHESPKHEALLNKSVEAIALKLGKALTPAIPNFLTNIPCELYIQVIEKLAEKNHWRQLDTFVRKYRTVQGTEQLKGFASGMTVVPVIRDQSLQENEDLKLQIMNNLLNSGASLGGDGGQTAVQTAQKVEHYKVLSELILQGADTTTLTFRDGDTPIHAALTLVLEKTKALGLLDFLLDRYEQFPAANKHLSPDQLDVNGDCLFHIVARAKYSSTALKVTELLCKRKLSAHYYNKEGKLPMHYLSKKNDRRLQYLRLAGMVEPSYDPSQAKFSKKSESEQASDFDDELNGYVRPDEAHAETVIKEVLKVVPLRDQMKNMIEGLIKLLPDSGVSIFTVDHPAMNKSDSGPEAFKDAETAQKDGTKKTGPKGDCPEEVLNLGTITTQVADHSLDTHSDEVQKISASENDKPIVNSGDKDLKEPAYVGAVATPQVEGAQGIGDRNGQDGAQQQPLVPQEQDRNVQEVEESESDDDFEEEEEVFEIDVQIFDNLEWEVECTAEFWKTLRDKHVPKELKRRIIRKIQLLASGDWQPVLCKKLTNTVPELRLYEAKFSKGSRILWELAVAFSPRCSETADRRLNPVAGEMNQPVKGGRIYSEIIRVWDIVLDHDKIHRSVERINKSHKRGEQCIIQKKLRGIKSDDQHIPIGAGKCYPRIYAEEDVTVEEIEEHKQEMQRFFPPASANDAEFHILKFYSFSSALVSHVLQNIETKVDFPFRVTDLEHAIINLSSKAPILLLGRSGTGKTTCCMYRLWSQFHTYWTAAQKADAPILPRCIEFVHRDVEDDKAKKDDEDEGTCDPEDEEEIEDEVLPGAVGGAADEENNNLAIFDHIHQVFITKNAVLCSEVQKNFRELSHADELMETHVQHETDVLPNRLQDVGDYSYPLFITSKQLLLMLDASIDPPHFFERKDDGSLKVEVAGWMDTEGPLGVLTLLNEDSDAEEEEEELHAEFDDFVDGAAGASTTGRRPKTDPRREITYAVFVEEVWPRIRKSQANYHPSLVWTEIMSFIKGSYEALTKTSGYLKLEEYVKLGRKRASNFSGDRETIYQLFKKYEHFRRQHQLFDETDLVHSVYTRLAMRKSSSLPWVIHQIYVDETQDFTQAELCLMIRLCLNPNDMFLTGDTAQSIMRGIAFRFSDLRSLFYHAKQSMHAMGKTSAIEVPKQVYQLTHNYRSHAGILSLATSILELMVEFFPESFDRLQPDQGLFHGPQPILLESCSFGDLAVLLRGNRRKTSHIEFGAHQAILVVNDETRDKIPEELRLGLVLTIYEAKGLEFDDVLLYNFFKDSQANKEWRVVTEFLERLAAKHQEMAHSERGKQENLVAIDAEILRQGDRPRPLDFDPNQHKVLNSELKHLYTALTRARVNVWIFDEDEERRKPMFEYFKARKLVKSLTVSEINESSLTETMFAEKSSPEDWCKRGEDFMRHSLYGVAAKCFNMGHDQEKEKIALAHDQALKASRLKEKPVLMREEFLYAAQLYLECGKPKKAAICLQNARERELSAQLFEKLGEFDRSAELYKRLNRPMASSRCYEQLGKFNKAVEVLSDTQNYELAIDTLQRYHMLISDLRRDGNMIPCQLIENPPDATRYTEEKLCRRAAELFQKNKNVSKMLEAVERFSTFELQVTFLKSNKYIEHAADILEKHGKLAMASQLLLCHGKCDKAIMCARRTLQEETIGNALLVSCRVLVRKKSLTEDQQHHLKEDLQEANDMFESCNDRDKLGEVSLLMAKLSKKNDDMKNAWEKFDTDHLTHSAGLLEVANLLVQEGLFDNITILKKISESIGHMFKICRVLLQPRGPTDQEMVRKFHSFYGLTRLAVDTVEVHPKEKPICLEMIECLFESKAEMKIAEKSFDIQIVHEKIVHFLLSRTRHWLEPLWEGLKTSRHKVSLCKFYRDDLDCPLFNGANKTCHFIHHKQTRLGMEKLFEMDIALLKMEANVLKGEDLLKQKCPEAVIRVTKDFLEAGERVMGHKFRACKFVWSDLIPSEGHSMLIADDSRELLQFLVRETVVQNHLQQFLFETWRVAVTPPKAEKLLKCTSVRETEVFLQLLFGFHLFGLSTGKKHNQIGTDPKKMLTKLESELEKEVIQKNKEVFQDRYYTVMKDWDRNNKLHLECIAHRFFDAFDLMINSRPDPYEAIFKFNKFVFQVDKRRDATFFPDFKHYLMWMEFFITLAFFLVAKMKSENFKDLVFILPSQYIALQQFVAATFPGIHRLTTLQAVEFWNPRNLEVALRHIQERLAYLVNAVSGEHQGVKLLAEIAERCRGDPDLIPILERFIILDLFLLSNVGKVVSAVNEPGLLNAVRNIAILEGFPQRLCRIITNVRNAVGLADVAHALKNLLESRDRDEVLLVCKWVGGKKAISTLELKETFLFSDSFLNQRIRTEPEQGQALPSTGITVDLPYSDEQLEAGLTEEEMERGRMDKEKLEMHMKEIGAAAVIIRFFRRISYRKKKQLQKESAVEKLFQAVRMDEHMCGWCGFNFDQSLADKMALNENVVIGEKSVINAPLRNMAEAMGWENKMDASARSVSSPEKDLPETAVWGRKSEDSSRDEAKKSKLLEEIRNSHKNTPEHQQRCMEFNKFKEAYNQDIAPEVRKVQTFLYNSDYGMQNKEYCKKHYPHHEMEISRMITKCSDMERNVQKQLSNKKWDIGRMQQDLKELRTDFGLVQPYVEDVQDKIRKEEEAARQKQAQAASTKLSQPEEGFWDEDDELDIEIVVEEPKMKTKEHRNRDRFYKNSNRRH